jgi:hypothetical protein
MSRGAKSIRSDNRYGFHKMVQLFLKRHKVRGNRWWDKRYSIGIQSNSLPAAAAAMHGYEEGIRTATPNAKFRRKPLERTLNRLASPVENYLDSTAAVEGEHSAGHLHFLDFIDRPNDKREVSVKGAIEHVTHITLAFGGLLLAMRAHFAPKCCGVIQHVIAVRRLHDMHDARKIFFQPAVKLRRKTAVTVTIAVDALHAHFVLHCLPILSKHDDPPSSYESQSSNSFSELSTENELKCLFSWFCASNADTRGLEPRTTTFVTVYIIVIATAAVNANHIPLFIGVIYPHDISTFRAFILMLESYVKCFRIA